jgi:hypothetical protein
VRQATPETIPAYQRLEARRNQRLALLTQTEDARVALVRSDDVDHENLVRAIEKNATNPPEPTKPKREAEYAAKQAQLRALDTVLNEDESELRAVLAANEPAILEAIDKREAEARKAITPAVEMLRSAVLELGASLADRSYLADVLAGRKANWNPGPQYVNGTALDVLLAQLTQAVEDRGRPPARSLPGPPVLRLPPTGRVEIYQPGLVPEADVGSSDGRESVVLVKGTAG